MRVGIITFHASYNFGSALQAYAMQTVVESLGHTAAIIDYKGRDWDQYKLVSVRHPRKTLRVFANFRGYYERRISFECFSATYLKLTRDRYSYANEDLLDSLQADFDCFLCGSDQIWNLDCTHGVVEPFFLSFAGDKRRVAYAPSLAHTEFRQEFFNGEKVADLLRVFDYLSVREKETVPLFQSLVDKPIDVVLDPTLLLGVGAYEKLLAEPPIKGDYIFVYLLRNCPELVKSAVAIANRTGKRIVYVSELDLPIPGGKNMFGIGPSEFLSLIANADVVLANSFHAVVFSTLFRKPFRAFATDRSGARMRDLLDDLGMGKRCAETLDSSPITDVDWEDVAARLDALRVHSFDYLRKALS